MTKPANLQNIDILFWNTQYFQRCRIKPLGESDNWLRKKWFPIASNVTGCVRLTIAVLQIRKKKGFNQHFSNYAFMETFQTWPVCACWKCVYFLSSFLPSFFHLRTLNKTIEVAHPSSDLGISGNNWDDFSLCGIFPISADKCIICWQSSHCPCSCVFSHLLPVKPRPPSEHAGNILFLSWLMSLVSILQWYFPGETYCAVSLFLHLSLEYLGQGRGAGDYYILALICRCGYWKIIIFRSALQGHPSQMIFLPT